MFARHNIVFIMDDKRYKYKLNLVNLNLVIALGDNDC